MSFAVSPDATGGPCPIDVTVVECYTLDEEETLRFATGADSLMIHCNEHQPELIFPVPATRSGNGLSGGWRCAVCDEVITEQAAISPARSYWLPAALTVIEDEAFAGTTVEQVTVPEGVRSIGASAFAGSDHLLLAVLPASVTHIGSNAFSDCPQVVLMVPQGSVAQRYAIENSLNYAVTDVTSPDD